jgi:hypothetical protein
MDTVTAMGLSLAQRYHFDDFTETSYREFLVAARSRYSFEEFGTTSGSPHVLWRHDLDFSVHRGLALAQIEADEGVRSTYFFAPRSEGYNLLEESVLGKAREILALGHWAGLHCHAHADRELAEQLAFERDLLETVLEQSVKAFSFHNPEVANVHTVDADEIAGLANAAGRGIRERYAYVTDSNGYWRHRRLPDVLAEGEEDLLHVLTHPEWWAPEPMSPRERLERCIEGRARDTGRRWDELLDEWGRENVGRD